MKNKLIWASHAMSLLCVLTFLWGRLRPAWRRLWCIFWTLNLTLTGRSFSELLLHSFKASVTLVYESWEMNCPPLNVQKWLHSESPNAQNGRRRFDFRRGFPFVFIFFFVKTYYFCMAFYMHIHTGPPTPTDDGARPFCGDFWRKYDNPPRNCSTLRAEQLQ